MLDVVYEDCGTHVIAKFHLGDFCLNHFNMRKTQNGCQRYCCRERMMRYDWCEKGELYGKLNELAASPKEHWLVFDGGQLTACPYFKQLVFFLLKRPFKRICFFINMHELSANYRFFGTTQYLGKGRMNVGVFIGNDFTLCSKKEDSETSQRGFSIGAYSLLCDAHWCFPIAVPGLTDFKIVWLLRSKPLVIKGFLHEGLAKLMPFPQKEIDEFAKMFKATRTEFYHVDFDELALKQLGLIS